MGGDECTCCSDPLRPLCPLSFYPLSAVLLPKGCSVPGKRTQSESVGRCLEPELRNPSLVPSQGGTNLWGGWTPGEGDLPSLFYILVETRPHWGDPERLSTEFQHPALTPEETLAYFYPCRVGGVGPSMILLMIPDRSLNLHRLQSSTQTQPNHAIPHKGSFIEKGFGDS